MKFDTTPDRQAGVNTDKRKKLGLAPEDKLWVCGSTHPGDEKVIFTAYKDLLVDFPRLKLLVAPRHPQRCAEIERLAQELGLRALSISHADLTNLTGTPVAFLLDTVGELVNYYAAADIVFVGGSLVKKGGHNILEPAFFAKPIIFGPQMFNFHDIAELFLAQNAAVMVYNGKELKDSVARILCPGAGNLLGENAQKLITQNQGATARNMRAIERIGFFGDGNSCQAAR
jgi:3-deoxy-D-manno-octulosonic-acid transferase